MAVTINGFISPQAPQSNAVVTTTANTTYTSSPTNTAVLATMGANGGRVTRIRSTPRATATTAMQLYVSHDAGVTKILIDSALVAATISTTTEIVSTDWGYSESNPLVLKAGAILYVAQSVTVADGVATQIEWGDY